MNDLIGSQFQSPSIALVFMSSLAWPQSVLFITPGNSLAGFWRNPRFNNSIHDLVQTAAVSLLIAVIKDTRPHLPAAPEFQLTRLERDPLLSTEVA